jgi:2-methylisocitrate lyase-like PEP mutase family enzyme
MSTLAERRAAFRALHQSGCFAIPNPWDGGSALRLAKHGFKALASTSAGAAWALGKGDGEMTLDEVLAHLTFLVGVTDLPVNADFETGFADSAQGVGENVARCVATGVAGLSIEDRDGRVLYDEDQAVARIRAARAAIDASGQDVLLTGRCEGFLLGKPDINLVIDRLKAYAEAGADCVYAPGIKELGAVAKIVQAVDKPVNANLAGTGFSVGQFAKIGVRRVSVGAALARATYANLDGYASLLAQEGRLP